ncbi:MAG TPA: hypothetical protein VM689_00875 [Aliidongia sp.]|nr:hypothetical protein [Aliidongia sp.]
MLGRQDVVASREQFARILDTEGFASHLDRDSWQEQAGWVTPETFFGALGFPKVESMDISDVEGAEIVFDLNEAATPPHLVGRCDVLFTGGTLEHVFHLPNALARCADILKDGGAFVHIGPLNNYADHGFYQFSATLWFDWFAVNGWSVQESVLVRLPSYNRPEPSGWGYSFLPPDRLGRVGQLAMRLICISSWPGRTPARSPIASRCRRSTPSGTKMCLTRRAA